LDSFGVLRTYKGQYGVENDFAFLKDPLVVNDLFLKTPARIDALGMILVLALLIARLMEVRMRRFLKNLTKPSSACMKSRPLNRLFMR
jgi:transposase